MNDLITRNSIINRLSQKYSGNARDDLGRLMGNSRDKNNEFFYSALIPAIFLFYEAVSKVIL